MKRITLPLSCLVIALLLQSNAFSASSILEETHDVVAPLPHEAQSTLMNPVETGKSFDAIEANYSTWQPNRVVVNSRIKNASAFKVQNPRTISVNEIHSLSTQFSLKIGAQFLALSRSGTTDSAGLTAAQEQNILVPSIRAGLEYQPNFLSTKRLQTYASAALLPSYIVSQRSVFDDGEANFGLPFEASIGELVHISSAIDLNVNLTETLGKVQDSDLQKLGLNLGVRILL